LIDSVARRSPKSALQILKSQPGSAAAELVSKQIFEQWSQRDPAGCSESGGGARKRNVAGAGVAVGRGKLGGARSGCCDQVDGIVFDKVSQNKLLANGRAGVGVNEPRKVIEWAGKLTRTRHAPRHSQVRAISQLAQSDAAPPHRHIYGRLRPVMERDNLVTQVAYAVSSSDTKARIIDIGAASCGSVADVRDSEHGGADGA
jgi:hypothetical protein